MQKKIVGKLQNGKKIVIKEVSVTSPNQVSMPARKALALQQLQAPIQDSGLIKNINFQRIL